MKNTTYNKIIRLMVGDSCLIINSEPAKIAREIQSYACRLGYKIQTKGVLIIDYTLKTKKAVVVKRLPNNTIMKRGRQ